MGLRLASLQLGSSFLGSAWALARQWSLEIKPWAELAERDELQNASLAIVGNAGYLAELPQGKQIDACDLVLRMNNFRCTGFEQQVGSRTDIFLSSFYTDVNFQNPALAEAKLLIASVPNNIRRDRPHGVLNRHGVQIASGLDQLRRKEVYVPGWEYFLEQKDAIGKYPTSGAMAIFLATSILANVCRSIYLTGFSFFRGPSHYFSDQTVVPRNHDPEREERLTREVLAPHVAAGRITLDIRLQAQLGL